MTDARSRSTHEGREAGGPPRGGEAVPVSADYVGTEVDADEEPAAVDGGSVSAEGTWRKVVGFAGAGAALVGAAVVATLAATHKSAVRENARAYFNGVRDGSEGRWGDVFVGNGEE